MHPHGADRHTPERLVAEPARDARVEHAGEPEIGADAEPEDQRRGAVAHDERQRRLHVRHDAHRRALRVDPTPEREADWNVERRGPAHQTRAGAEDERTVEREVDRVRDHALPCLHAREHGGVPGAAGTEETAAHSDVERAARVAIHPFESRAAAVGKAQHRAELGALKRAIRRVEGWHAGHLCPGLRYPARHSRHCHQHPCTSHDSTPFACNVDESVKTGTHTSARRSPWPAGNENGPTAGAAGPCTLRVSEPQKRMPAVRMKVLPPPISPRASANGVRLLPVSLNVVPPSRFSPALVAEALTVPAVAEACAMFKPPPAYGPSEVPRGTRNR